MAQHEKMDTAREPTWDELGLDGRGERLRSVNRDLLQRVERLEEYIVQLLSHDHLQGHIVAPMVDPITRRLGGVSWAWRRLD